MKDEKVIPFNSEFSGRKFGSGGGSGMSKYVTHEELNSALREVAHQATLNHEKTGAKIDLLSHKFDGIERNITDKTEILLNEKEKEARKEATETRRYVFGTLIIGVAGILISLLG